MINKQAFTAGHFELMIDGHPTTAYVKTVGGGFVRGNPLDEPVGTTNHRIKHLSTVEIEPFTLDVGISGANDILTWIQASWRKQWNRRNGQVTHANFDLFRAM